MQEWNILGGGGTLLDFQDVPLRSKSRLPENFNLAPSPLLLLTQSSQNCSTLTCLTSSPKQPPAESGTPQQSPTHSDSQGPSPRAPSAVYPSETRSSRAWWGVPVTPVEVGVRESKRNPMHIQEGRSKSWLCPDSPRDREVPPHTCPSVLIWVEGTENMLSL